MLNTIAALALAQTTPVQPMAAPFITASRQMVGIRPVSLAARPGGSSVLAAGFDDGSIRLIDANTRQTARILKGHPQTVTALAFSPDGKWLASGDVTARIYIWKTADWTKAYEYRPHTRAVQSVSWNGASSRVMSTGGDDFVYMFKAPWKKESMKLPGNGAILYSGTFYGTTDDAWGVTALNRNARIMKEGAPVRDLIGHDGRGSQDLAFNPKGTWAATAGRDNRAALFDVKTGKRLGYFKGHQDWVVRVGFTPNSKYVITSSTDRTVRFWNPYNFQKVFEVTDQSAVGSPIAVTSNGKFAATTNIEDNLVIHTFSVAQSATPEKKAKNAKP